MTPSDLISSGWAELGWRTVGAYALIALLMIGAYKPALADRVLFGIPDWLLNRLSGLWAAVR